MHRFKLLLKLVLKSIDRAEEEEINEIIHALILRQGKLFPEYELIVMSLPKCDRFARDYQLNRIVELLRKQEYVGV